MRFFWKRSGSAETGSRNDDPQPGDDTAYPGRLGDLERSAVKNRRKAAGFEPDDPQVPIGLACSGGGIRSATVCLGVFQALARSNLLRRVDFLSTVSGGGYAGTFLGHLYLRRYVDPKNDDRAGKPTDPAGSDGYVVGTSPAERVSRILEDPHSKPLDHLRENGRYLSPNGAGDSLLAGAVVLRNWVAVQFVLLTFCFTGLLGFLVVRTVFAAAARLAGLGGLEIPSTSFIAGLLSYFNPVRQHAVWISDYFLLAAVPLVLWAVPVGLAYWLDQSRDLVIASALGVIALALLFLLGAHGLGAFLLAVGAYWLLSAVFWSVFMQGGWSAPDEGTRWKRGNRLSRSLTRALMAAGIVFAVAVIDTFGRNVHEHSWAWTIAKFSAVATSVLMFGKRLVPFIGDFTRGGRPKISVSVIAAAASIVLVLVVLGFLSGLAYNLVEAVSNPPELFVRWVEYWDSRLLGAVGGVLGFGVLCLIMGQTLSFLNRSSLQTLYSARLTRAYLGASNPARWKPEGMKISEAIDGDAVSWADYRPEKHGGPLHLINTTINETIDGRSQVEQRDRKGVPLAIGPFGLSAGVRHHALFTPGVGGVSTGHLTRRLLLESLAPEAGFRIFASKAPGEPIEVEPLTLGEWVGISGAAFTTGIGYRTSLGLSLLSGMANVRLGYWWNSGVDPASRESQTPSGKIRKLARLPLLPVQRLLLSELLARFPGTALKWWYLSDGGHFENTAAYELIRRRLPLIIILDNGADPGCLFEDIGSLVRKARLDFETEIRFAGEEYAGQPVRITKKYEESVGTLAQLKPAPPAEGGRPRSARHIAAGAIYYPDGQRGLLLVVKPTLLGNEPSDVLQYHANHPLFPQEPTSDQFFDEAQWESYHKLGDHIGARLCELLTSLQSATADTIGAAVISE